MLASKIEPTSWMYGSYNLRKAMLMRKWDNIRRNVRLMEDSLPLLMNNPETTPEQLVLASKIYTNVTQQLHDHAMIIDTFIYHGHKLKHMQSCPTYRTGNESLCECKDWQEEPNNVSE